MPAWGNGTLIGICSSQTKKEHQGNTGKLKDFQTHRINPQCPEDFFPKKWAEENVF